MIICGYSIFDKGVQSFSKPYFAEHEVQARRDFLRLCNDENTKMFNFADEFQLYKVCEYNTDTGETINKIEKIIDGKNIERNDFQCAQ